MSKVWKVSVWPGMESPFDMACTRECGGTSRMGYFMGELEKRGLELVGQAVGSC